MSLSKQYQIRQVLQIRHSDENYLIVIKLPTLTNQVRLVHSFKPVGFSNESYGCYELVTKILVNNFYLDAGDNLPNILLRSPPRDAQIIPEAKTTPQAGSEQFSSSPIKISPVLSSPGALSYCGGELESPLALASPYRSPFRYFLTVLYDLE